MPDLFDNQPITFPCPKCGQQHAKTLRWLEANDHLACSCGARISLDTSELRGLTKQIERELAKLPREINIKF